MPGCKEGFLHRKENAYVLSFYPIPQMLHLPKGKTMAGRSRGFLHRPIVEENPTEQELSQWIARSGLPIKRFFNTSGLKYKALELKDKLPLMSEEEMVALLATDGMLVKRPLLIGEDTILVGFKPQEWESIL